MGGGKGEEGLFLSDPDHFRKTPVVSRTIYYHLSSRKPPSGLVLEVGRAVRQLQAGSGDDRRERLLFMERGDLTRRRIRQRR